MCVFVWVFVRTCLIMNATRVKDKTRIYCLFLFSFPFVLQGKESLMLLRFQMQMCFLYLLCLFTTNSNRPSLYKIKKLRKIAIWIFFKLSKSYSFIFWASIYMVTTTKTIQPYANNLEKHNSFMCIVFI